MKFIHKEGKKLEVRFFLEVKKIFLEVKELRSFF